MTATTSDPLDDVVAATPEKQREQALLRLKKRREFRTHLDSVAGRSGPCLPPRDPSGYPVLVGAGVLVEVPVPPPLSPSRWAAATTH